MSRGPNKMRSQKSCAIERTYRGTTKLRLFPAGVPAFSLFEELGPREAVVRLVRLFHWLRIKGIRTL